MLLCGTSSPWFSGRHLSRTDICPGWPAATFSATSELSTLVYKQNFIFALRYSDAFCFLIFSFSENVSKTEGSRRQFCIFFTQCAAVFLVPKILSLKRFSMMSEVIRSGKSSNVFWKILRDLNTTNLCLVHVSEENKTIFFLFKVWLILLIFR